MTAILALIGRFAWPLLAAWLPGMGPRTILAVIGLVFSGVAIGGPALAVWLHMHHEMKQEIAATDDRWRTELKRADDAHTDWINQVLIDVGREEQSDPTPVDRDNIKRMCDQSRTCRSRKK
jgi:hypothetical protein